MEKHPVEVIFSYKFLTVGGDAVFDLALNGALYILSNIALLFDMVNLFFRGVGDRDPIYICQNI